MLGLRIVPTLTMAADAQPVVGVWEGTLDPGDQPKKRILVHISAATDGSLSGTIDYPDQDSNLRLRCRRFARRTSNGACNPL